MIEAELQGKVSSGLQGVEDLLTSAVFGLLQYVSPSIFWSAVLTRAKSCKGKLFNSLMPLFVASLVCDNEIGGE
jgi:hypothetical protein